MVSFFVHWCSFFRPCHPSKKSCHELSGRPPLPFFSSCARLRDVWYILNSWYIFFPPATFASSHRVQNTFCNAMNGHILLSRYCTNPNLSFSIVSCFIRFVEYGLSYPHQVWHISIQNNTHVLHVSAYVFYLFSSCFDIISRSIGVISYVASSTASIYKLWLNVGN